MSRDQSKRFYRLITELTSSSSGAGLPSTIEGFQSLFSDMLKYQEALEQENSELQQEKVKLKASCDHHLNFYEQSSVGYATFLWEEGVTEANTALIDMLGGVSLPFSGDALMQLISLQDKPTFQLLLQRLNDGHEGYGACELILIRPNKSNLAVHLEVNAIIDNNACCGYYLCMTDVSEQAQVESELRLSASAFEHTTDGILITDAYGNIISVNQAFTQTTGYLAEDVLGEKPQILSSGKHDANFYKELWACVSVEGSWQGEIWNRRKSGEIYPEWLSISSIKDHQGEITHYVGAFADITELKASQHNLEYLAHHDPLTKLPNRLLLSARLELSLQKSERKNGLLAILYLDLDGFKDINDTLGHSVGDELLIQSSHRLMKTVRAEDTIARVGGDEFVIVLESVKKGGDAALTARKILEVLNSSFEVAGQKLLLSGSIGISIYPDDGNDMEVLLQNADAAMYKAKQGGRNRYRFYSPEFTIEANERVRMDIELREALNKDQFVVNYQPQFSLQDGSLVGAEALVRWQHPTRGLLLPAQFITTAELTGNIAELTDWVLRHACGQWIAWKDRGLELSRMSIHLSRQQIYDRELASRLGDILQESGCSAQNFNLEVTEGFVMRDIEASTHSLDELHVLGIHFSIDDFGTGYSSLSHLKRLPIEKLKIDRSFVQGIGHDSNDEAIIRAITLLGNSLQLIVIAEGVESKQQRDFLASVGCHQAQGRYWGMPVSGEEFLKLNVNYDM